MRILINCGLSVKKQLILLSLILLLVALPAWGTLGGSVASVKADEEKVNGTLQVTHLASYEIHEIQMAQNAKIREFVSPSGTVFGVAWQGPWKPDLQQLLGPYFDQYVSAVQSKKTVRGAGRIELPGLVVQMSGHPRSFFGRAYIPQMIPQGASADVIK